MRERKYLPTFAELVDRLSIVQLKAIYIPEHKAEYDAEIEDILHDIGLLTNGVVRPEAIRAIVVLGIVNRVIWENESKAREGSSEQNDLLRFTHSLNGIRNQAKNLLSKESERKDYKVDCLAADLPKEFGNWNIWANKPRLWLEDEACGTQWVREA